MSVSTKFGRYQVPEAPSALTRTHLAPVDTTKLRMVDHEPKMAVLGQEDLLEQGIDVSTFIPGAPTGVDALGSCTANATTVALSNVLPSAEYFQRLGVANYQDTKNAQIFAIRFYHSCTDDTGDTATEWPPNDCGSSGPYIVQQLQQMQLIKSDVIANNGVSILALMQTGGLLVGQPWFNNWMSPDANGFIDGAGIEADIASGVAGGHETYWSAIEKLVVSATGHIDTFNTIMRARNSWTKSWGDNGSYRFRLSSYLAVANHCDWRQIIV